MRLSVKDILFCLLSALLLTLSFSSFNLEFLAWVGFIPFFFALQGKSKGKAFLFSYITGIIFWSCTIYWLIHVTLLGLILLVLYLALYFGLFGFIFSTSELRTSTSELLFIPATWVLLEYLRGHLLTGFPWALLGYSQYQNPPVIQIADITGAWGVSFLVIMINIAVYSLFVNRYSLFVKIKNIFITILILLVAVSYGFYKLRRTPNSELRTPIKISVIQPNIAQELKWDPGARNYILDKYFQLSKKAAQDAPDLIIWPEAAVPGILGEDASVFKKAFSLTKEIEIPLLIGGVVFEKGNYFNSALLIDENKLMKRYDKLHLVPFGEYIPLKKILPFLETVVPIGDITAGKEYTVFTHELRTSNFERPVYFSVLICFEDLFPELSREFVRRGAHFLINITNDAWYKETPASYQHLQASVFRAVENRVFLVRSANTGISGFIKPTGAVLSLVKDQTGRKIFVEGFNTQNIYLYPKRLTFYTRNGDVFILPLLIFIIYSIFRLIKPKYRM